MYRVTGKILFALLLLIQVNVAQASKFFKKKHQKVTVKQLDRYYKRVSKGAIYLSKPSDNNFYIDKHKMKATSEFVFDYDYVQNIFATNIYKYIENESAQDFLHAKKKFYARRSFKKSEQTFSRPYVYLSAWNSLNHPQIKKLDLPLEVYDKNMTPLDYSSLDSVFFEPKFQRELDDLTHTELTYGNELKQLNNNESFYARLDLIASAKYYFFGVVMAHYCDKSSNQLIDAMIERAHKGVDVRIIVEGIWTSLVFKKCVKKMREGGIKVMLSNNFFKKDSMFTVLHDKIWIADGSSAIIGGQNVQSFENESTGYNMHTRDKDVLVRKGPAVTDMLGEYIKLWNHFKRKNRDSTIKTYETEWRQRVAKERESGVRGEANYTKWLKDKDKRMNGICRVVVQGKQTENSIVAKAYMKIINAVQKSIDFSTPNLKFDIDGKGTKLNSTLIYAMIKRARVDEIKVDVVSNGIDASGTESGYHLRGLAKKAFTKGKFRTAKAYLKAQDLIAKSIAKKQYKTMGFMAKTLGIDAWSLSNHIHAKQIIFDRILTSTGSFNFDSHSYKNHESTIICLDKKLAHQAELGVTMDKVNSVPVY